MNKIKIFFKKYGYYVVAGVLMVALFTTIGLSASSTTVKTQIDAKNPVVSVGGTSALTFTLPMDEPNVIKEYSGSELMWNETFAWWEAHEAMDLSSSNSKVYSVADGTIKAITEDVLEGTKIVISHMNGLESIYSSLDKNVNVKEGDKVTKGQHIGNASNTSGNEESIGNHLHFEMIENNKKIDPNNYLELSNK